MKLWICTVSKQYTLQQDFTNLLLREKLNKQIDLEFIYISGRRFNNGNKYDEYKIDLEQVSARNEYLESVPEGDFILILDSDEVLAGAIESIVPTMEKMESLGLATCFIKELLPDNKFQRRPRLLRKVRGMQYYYKHDIIININELPSTYYYEPSQLVIDNDIGAIYNYIHPDAINSMSNPYLILVHFKELKNIEFLNLIDDSSS